MTIHPIDKTDVLVGHKSIAIFLGMSPRQVSWHDEQGNIPTFKLGRSVCARKTSLIKWIEDQEKERRDAKKRAL